MQILLISLMALANLDSLFMFSSNPLMTTKRVG
jgi:hypothetical protein